MSTLNPDQLQAIESDTHCQIVACPGAGKTRVLTEKIGALINRHGPNTRIVAVTFTRESARELGERAAATIGESAFKRLCRVGTFHSLAIRLLRNNKRLGIVATPAQSYAFLRRAMGLTDTDLSYEDATAILEKAKTSLGPCEEQEHPLYQQYQNLLRNSNLCDLYDVLRDCVVLMRRREISPYPARFMLVDEFQDTDDIQLQWVLEHAKAGTIVTVVGDDDQAIYGFRGSMGYAGLEQFAAETKAQRITLGHNYRCRREILEAADTLIRFNEERIPKNLVAARGQGGKLQSRRYGTESDEAADIIAELQPALIRISSQSLFDYSTPNKAWAILARGRRQLDEVEIALQNARIQYYRPGGDSIWNRPPFLHMLSFLRSLQEARADGLDAALHHALSARMLASDAQRTLNEIHNSLGDRFTHLFDQHLINIDRYKAEEQGVLTTILPILPKWRELLRDGRIGLLISNVANWFARFESDEQGRELVIKMGETIGRLRGSLVERVNALSSLSPKPTKPDATPENGSVHTRGVALLTMHASKGLEFDTVWIVRTEDSVIPSPKSIDISEERRLMYVAITRAKDRLFVSSVMPSSPSPFILEAGLDPKSFLLSPSRG